MRRYSYETDTAVSADRLFRAKTTFEVFGPPAFLWDRIVASKLAADCEQQTRAFIVAGERQQ